MIIQRHARGMLDRSRMRKSVRNVIMSLSALIELRKLKMSEVNYMFRTIAGSDIVEDALQKEANHVSSILDGMQVCMPDFHARARTCRERRRPEEIMFVVCGMMNGMQVCLILCART